MTCWPWPSAGLNLLKATLFRQSTVLGLPEKFEKSGQLPRSQSHEQQWKAFTMVIPLKSPFSLQSVHTLKSCLLNVYANKQCAVTT